MDEPKEFYAAMMKIFLKFIIPMCSLLMISCSTQQKVVHARSMVDCESASVCKLTGNLEEVWYDHGFVSILRLNDNSCVNVSLPDKIRESLAGRLPKRMTLTGLVKPYPFGEDLFVFTVNGRKIGWGNVKCGLYYIFVR